MKTTSTYCTLRWGYPIVDFGRGSIRTCCRTFEERVEPEEFEQKGSDIFLNSDYQIKALNAFNQSNRFCRTGINYLCIGCV